MLKNKDFIKEPKVEEKKKRINISLSIELLKEIDKETKIARLFLVI